MHTNPLALTRTWKVLFLLLLAAAHAWGQKPGVFQRRTLRDDAGAHTYVVFTPKAYTVDKTWPVILYLHTAGERGNDGEKQVMAGLGPAIWERRETFGYIAVFPQCEATDTSVRQAWSPDAPDGRRALAILDEVLKQYSVDKDRILLTGASMGGYGVWSQAAANPDRWAAIVPLCGGGEPAWAERIARLPIWAFHGANDRAVMPAETVRMIDAIKAANGQPRYTEMPGVEHNAWDYVYRQDELWQWLDQQRRGAASSGGSAGLSQLKITPTEGPFIPVLHIADAAYVRMGNEMLKVLGAALPQLAPADALSGRLPDQSTVSQTQVGPMDVQFRGLSYAGKIGWSTLQARDDGRLAIMLTANNIRLTINSTSVVGAGRSADCGPIRIHLGHLRPLRLDCVVEPSVVADRLKLKLVDASFRIPEDNMQVDGPDWVDGRGLGMTSDRVSSGLQQGFYQDRPRLERQVVEALPAVLDRLTSNLPLEQAQQLIAGIWPLPVYKPRVKAFPSGVSVDGRGVTVRLGVSVAAVTESQAKSEPKRISLAAEKQAASPTDQDFQFAIAPALLEHLGAPLVEADVARVLVVDTPLKKLHALAAKDELAQIVPDLKQRGTELRAELVMADTAKLNRLPAENGKEPVELALPKVLCQVSIRENAESAWAPYVEFEFHIRQRAVPELAQPTHTKRALALAWQGDAAVEVLGRFQNGVAPKDGTLDLERLKAVVADAWREWTTTGPLASTAVDDLTLGMSKLRAQRLNWDGPYLATTFVPPGISIRTTGDAKIEYETKTLFSTWGGPYKVDATKPHNFPVAEPFIIRFKSAGKELQYTLAPGLRFEFRPGEKAGELELRRVPEDAS